MKLLALVQNLPLPARLALGFGVIGLVGLFDDWMGYRYSASVFYVLPIALITWTTFPAAGFAAAILSALVWLWAEVTSGRFYDGWFNPLWNTGARAGVFLFVVYLLAKTKSLLAHERKLAVTDPLTKVFNTRHYRKVLASGLARLAAGGPAFSVAYLDLDNFKKLNDRLGHGAGDEALCAVAAAIREVLRRNDCVARLGGDEFSIFFDGASEEEARAVLGRLDGYLSRSLRSIDPTLGFSCGVVTFHHAPASVDTLIQQADQLMYSAKFSGKNRTLFESYNGEPIPPTESR